MPHEDTVPIDRPQRAKLRDFWPYIKDHRISLGFAIAASIISTALAVVQPLVVQELISSAGTYAAVLPNLIALLVAVTIGEAAFSSIRSYLLQRTGEAAVLGIRSTLLGKLLRLRIVEYDKRSTGDLLSRAGADSSNLRAIVTSGVFDLGAAILMFAAAVILMVAIDWMLFVIVLSAIVVGTTAVLALSRLLRGASRDVQDEVGSMTVAIDRSISAVRTIRAALATEAETRRVTEAAASAYRAGVRVAKLNALIRPVVSLCIQSSIVIVLAVGGVRVATGDMSLGDMVAFVLYLSLLVQPVSQGLGAVSQTQSALAALDRIEEILDLDSEQADEVGLPEPAVTSPNEAAIEFRDVVFVYEDGPRALHGVDLVIRTGTRNALVGPSGAGKSTVLALIERFYEPSSGSILIGGVQSTAMTREQLRARFGYVEQDAPAISGTIGDNLRLGAPLADEAAMREALAQVGLTGLIERSSQGLETRVGEEGVLLSGGERQRLAWARVLLADPQILLLDEPTSAVDASTESLLQGLLASQKRTVLVVAHRLATVVESDQIIVMDEGRAVASGSHDELIESSALYRELASRQLLV